MRSLVLTISLIAGVAGAAEVFRWVDEDGQVHFSDRPQEGAERVVIDEPQTIQAPAPRRTVSAGNAGEDAAEDEPFSYQSLEIVTPGQEEVLWNIEGQLDVSMRLQPRLQRGHNLELSLDGQPVQMPRRNSLQVTVPEVFRGVHVLRAKVTDRGGRVLIESDPRTFAVQQTSIQNPNNPANAPIATPLPAGGGI